MRAFQGFRCVVAVLILIMGASFAVAPAHADSGTIRLRIIKGGWFIGASGGEGSLTFKGKRYPLAIGGLSAGLVFGASEARLVGTVRNIRRASDINGVYGAVGAGGAVGVGARVIQLRNGRGVVLSLRGEQVGLLLDFDLSGMSLSLR